MNVKIMKTGMMLLVTGILLVGLIMVNGCKKDEPAPAETVTSQMHEHDESDGHVHDQDGNHVEAVAAAIEQETCPIMEGNPINKALFVEYKGKKVYFCCPGCEDKFNAEPEKYVAKLPQFKQ